MATLCLVAHHGKMIESFSSIEEDDDEQAEFEVCRPVILPEELTELEPIGDGITSVVFKGLWQGNQVAIKEMKRDSSNMSAKARVNLQREVAILEKVNHPNLVQLVGVCDEDYKVKIIFEFCCGGDAFDLLHNRGRTLAWEQKFKLLGDVSAAMRYLHSMDPPIVHRDLKSLNLLLVREVNSSMELPECKVTDFGLARITAAPGSAMTKDAGTCHWMAPEVFQGNSYDKRVDVYSFGMIMFEVLCQDIPFREIPSKKLGLLVTQGHRPAFKRLPADCPKHFEALMKMCWSHKPSDRPSFKFICDLVDAAM